MSLISLGYTAALVLAGFCIAVAALLVVSVFLRSGRARDPGATPPEIGFLFDGPMLVDATTPARRVLDFARRLDTDMDTLVGFLSPRFPDLATRVTACGEDETIQLLSCDDAARLTLCARDGRLRLSLEDLSSEPGELPDRFSFAALADALRRHRRIADACPLPVWRQDGAGHVVWANECYRALARRVAGPGGGNVSVMSGLDLSTGRPGETQRIAINLPDTHTPLWFDCHVSLDGDGATVTALPADGIVKAETSLRDFVQTLTRTFAHLSVGLAIFDRARALTVFNPALSDILGLPPEYLITHPTLSQVLDHLRERRMMPEPKNYKSWRGQMHALEAAAEDGRFSEIWPMPDGRMIRVIGRPHPGGAVAFMFEDISDEISATRRHRADLEVSHAVIDGLDEAVAVFTQAGRLSFCNRSYAAMWGLSEGREICGESFADATRRWQERCAPTPIWGDARDFAASIGERSNWSAEVRLCDGRQLSCRFETLPGGATLVGFAPQVAAPAVPVSAPAPTSAPKRTPAVLASVGG